MIGRRCDIGCATWPDKTTFRTCPQCGLPTTRYSNVTPMDPKEALSILRHQKFEEFYEKWCEERGQSVDGPLEGEPDPPLRGVPEAC